MALELKLMVQAHPSLSKNIHLNDMMTELNSLYESDDGMIW
ncbi:hypothetical protein [Haemophilus haemolyticus]|nr:hypothetical protein [Haemophilus haemolyticus]